MQVLEQIKQAGGCGPVGGVFEDRTRRLKVPGDGVVIRRGRAGLTLDRRHVRAKLPGVAVRKTQRGCPGLELAHDLANLLQVEVTDKTARWARGLPTWMAEPMASPSTWITEIGGKCSVAWSGAARDRFISWMPASVSKIMNGV